MKVVLIETGKTKQKEVSVLTELYIKRIRRYVSFEKITIPDLKNTRSLSEDQVKVQEGEMILRQFETGDHIILLDEKGNTFTSVKFAGHIQSLMNRGVKRIVFVIGGPYGFSEEVYLKANEKLSLSAMTFSHQLIRALFAEQLYRAFSILRNEPYHHE